jgi:hypothetical protein
MWLSKLPGDEMLTLYANVLAHGVFWLGACAKFDYQHPSQYGDIESKRGIWGSRCGITASFCPQLADQFDISHSEATCATNEAARPSQYKSGAQR